MSSYYVKDPLGMVIDRMDANKLPVIAKPKLIYDGDCEFCQYSVDYWQNLTKDQVDYLPYQRVMDQFPDISIEEFQSAVQYIAPNGEHYRAAKASFAALAHAPDRKIWLSLYQKLFGFAAMSEFVYKMIARNRNLAFKASKLLWGKHPVPPQYQLISWLFTRLFGVIFLIAFFSFTTQSLGLIGNQGISPLISYKATLANQFGLLRFWYAPMLFWLNSSNAFIEAVGCLGMLFSVSLILNILPRLSLFCLYILYLSYICAGQAFMSFQWDMLLVEIAPLAIILLSLPVLGVWMLRWLLFRFMFIAGYVKITSGDSSWWDLSVLKYHFFTQPLPTPIAWYADLLPSFVLKSATFLTLVIELIIPFFFFMPRRLRFFAAFATLILQLGIFLTGNYNFFNLTTMLLCLVLFDDAAISKIIPQKAIDFIHHRRSVFNITAFFKKFTYGFVVLSICLALLQFNDRFVARTITPTTIIDDIFAPFRFVNTYGPFAVMTKARYEIIIEGSMDGKTWHEYEFKYKPGNVLRRPLWNVPFQPRLDWQMWFAALSQPQQNPWYIGFVYRLLENSPDVVALLKHNPFPGKPPKLIRSMYYTYYFSTPAEKAKTGAWWTRRQIAVYLPAARRSD